MSSVRIHITSDYLRFSQILARQRARPGLALCTLLIYCGQPMHQESQRKAIARLRYGDRNHMASENGCNALLCNPRTLSDHPELGRKAYGKMDILSWLVILGLLLIILLFVKGKQINPGPGGWLHWQALSLLFSKLNQDIAR